MVKSSLEKNVLKFHGGLQRCLLTCQANSAFLGRFFCIGQQQLWRPSWNFKIFFSWPLFTIIFKPKMVSNLRKNFLCIVWHQKPTVKIEVRKKCFYKKWSPKLIFLNDFFEKNPSILDIENWLWKYDFGTFWHNSSQHCFKISFEHVDSWAKILHFKTHHL